METISPGEYPLSGALSSGEHRGLVYSTQAHPLTTVYRFTVTSRTDFTPITGTEDNALRGPAGAYIVLAAPPPLPPSREDGAICITIDGHIRNLGTGVYIVDQAHIANELVPIYGPALPDETIPVVGYRPAAGTRLLGAAVGGGFSATTTGSVDLTTSGLYGGGGTLNGKSFKIALNDLNPGKPKPRIKVTFSEPADAADVKSAINDACGATVASISRWNKLVLTSTKSVRLIAGDSDALAVLGLTAGTTTPLQTADKAYLFLRWDSVAKRWQRLAHGGYMTV